MDIRRRNNVQCFGQGNTTLLFAHGFGCDQGMWRLLTAHVDARCKIVLYDLAGCGGADPGAYDRARYATLQGHVADVLDIVEQCCTGPVVFVGHAIGAMIGMLATSAAPARFKGQVMLSASPCYFNDGTYVGGFNPEEAEQLLALVWERFEAGAASVAPLPAGSAHGPALQAEPAPRPGRHGLDITQHLARVAFLSDLRSEVPNARVPALILQSSDDLMVAKEVGDYLLAHLPHGTLVQVDSDGLCPHMSAPSVCVNALGAFLDRLQ